MRPTRLTSSLVALGALAAFAIRSAPASAHHSFAAEFDGSKPITLKGIVMQIDWTNPHVWFYLHVKDEEDGKAVRWALEMGAPHQLQQRGWLRDTMKIGDVVTVAGSLARDGSKRANARTVTTAEGKTLGAASSGDATTRQ
jgi:hypothetical protein